MVKTEWSVDEWKTMQTEEYAAYIKALCRLASGYVSRVRVQFAEKAFEKYADPTVRKLVLAYGEEIEKLDAERLRDFAFAARYGAVTNESLEDSCLNNAREYGKAIWFLFEINLKEE